MELITSITKLDDLRHDWEALAARLKSPLLEHDWFASCARTLCREEQLRIVIIRRGDRVTAAAPLLIRRQHGVKRLELIGTARLYEPSGLLFEDSDSLDELLAGIARLDRPVLLRRLAETSPLVTTAARSPRRFALATTRPAGVSLTVATDVDWESGATGKLRYDVRRARRKLEARGPMTVRIDRPLPEEVDALLDVFTGVERAGWKGRRRSSLADRKDLSAFFRTYLTRIASRGEALVAQLMAGANVIAAQLGIVSHERCWVLKIGYDESYAECSPGFLLTHEMLRYCHSEGLRSYEFLGLAEPWESRWRPESIAYNSVSLYPGSARGWLCASIDGALGGASQVAKALLKRRARAGPDRDRKNSTHP